MNVGYIIKFCFIDELSYIHIYMYIYIHTYLKNVPIFQTSLNIIDNVFLMLKFRFISVRSLYLIFYRYMLSSFFLKHKYIFRNV